MKIWEDKAMKILTIAIAATLCWPRRLPWRQLSDPLRVIYRVSGVLDNGDAATTRAARRRFSAPISATWQKESGSVYALRTTAHPPTTHSTSAAGETRTLWTHNTLAYDEDGTLAPGVGFRQGSAVISATTTNVHCSAVQVDASAATPIRHSAAYGPLTAGEQLAGIRAPHSAVAKLL